MNFKTILIIGAVAIVGIVALQNMNTITVRFLLWDITASQLFMIPFIFLAGLGIGVILGMWGGRKGKTKA